MSNSDFTRTLGSGIHPGFDRGKALFTRIHLDLLLVILLLVLCLAGLLILYTGSGRDTHMLVRQAVHMGIGLLGMGLAAQLPPRFYQMIAPWAYLLALVALISVLIAGVGAKGAQRWLALPGLPRFQPSELVKLILPLTVAWYMARRPVPPHITDLLKASGLIVIPTILILKQPDLGTSLLISASGLLVLFFAGMAWKLIGSLIAIVSACAPLMWFFVMHDYQKQRVLTFLNPESDPLGSGWNIIQSKTAIGSGGIEGKGFMQGTQSQLEFLPESHTDFIIAVLAEELGLIGVLLLLVLYFLIIFRCLVLSSRSETLFGRLLAGSLSVTFFIYVFVNIGMVSGILPVVGVPLPLVSYGGTSVVSLMTAFGLIMSMAIHQKR
ncbi:MULTISPECIES: rod shape-determining protein RodA [unclassified Oceanobacter]|jgi:rod shape determining protein RodA|uniref:rod shape-determining protein RodA n=2 Tax=Gammaproteobacteria TaxID=1236 RepID=UPI0026E2E768|nr:MULTISPECIES: rod shape-determining protein RodA [unclassified Oceanobacter]MDO6681823.1 rod shape-determining protein RodA [Oceanobacter sp. 5_MG-2023]MDP2506577.1 rod shape-determining protein RodA [Oceanobacter sp. 3_MG-2023]MDP2548976.1 rod shape-determining protein RodA [Oceanobacter sp. 4_MG-2023]MDP2609640.1 rod shape-determining protein RodA [Oceanobacter sp. 1_MG-2023]MDP2613358.1 rod shape-determining protein RodA [Oceanobacter sp. 2_MG-2023]